MNTTKPGLKPSTTCNSATMTFTSDDLETLYYACADGEKFWRYKRREVKAGQCDRYTEQDCTARMKHYHSMWSRLSYTQ